MQPGDSFVNPFLWNTSILSTCCPLWDSGDLRDCAILTLPIFRFIRILKASVADADVKGKKGRVQRHRKSRSRYRYRYPIPCRRLRIYTCFEPSGSPMVGLTVRLRSCVRVESFSRFMEVVFLKSFPPFSVFYARFTSLCPLIFNHICTAQRIRMASSP